MSRRFSMLFSFHNFWFGVFHGPKTGVWMINLLPAVSIVIKPKPKPRRHLMVPMGLLGIQSLDDMELLYD